MDRPLRVGIDARWHNDSGVGTYIRNLVNSLAQLDEEIEYILYVNPNQDRPWTVSGEVIQERRVNVPKYSLEEQIKLPRIIGGDRLDVLHVPFYVVPLWYSGRMVVTIHDLEQILFRCCAPKWPGRGLVRLMMRMAVRKADRVIAVSERTRQDLVEVLRVDPGKIRTVWHGCPPGYLWGSGAVDFPKLAERLGVRIPFVISCVGKQWRLKNTAAAILGFIQAKRDIGLPHQMVLVGKMGPEGEAFLRTKLVAEYLDSIVRTGYLSDGEVATLYSQADAFVFPSRYEGFGFPPLEAMACGAPVIASPCGSLREILGDVPIYVDPDDPPQIGRAIGALASDPALREGLSNAGREHVKAFSWRQTAAKTAETYWQASARSPAAAKADVRGD